MAPLAPPKAGPGREKSLSRDIVALILVSVRHVVDNVITSTETSRQLIYSLLGSLRS